MKLREFYKAAVAAGMAADPRGSEGLGDWLDQRRKKYEGLKGDAKEYFDTESLENPYGDTRILNGTGDEEIERVLVGIDIDAGEIVLADRLRERGQRVDLVLAHHPSGRALGNLHEVMGMQADILAAFGVPISAAEDLMDSRAKEVERRLMPGNHTRAADAARLLGIPFMCTHTPADNHVHRFLQGLVDAEKPKRLGDVVDLLQGVPEYKEGAKQGAGPRILLGDRDRKAGKVLVSMTGGTSGNKKLLENLAGSGVNTLVEMHMSDEHRDEAKKHHVNVIIAGHIASDTVGMNLMLDNIIKSAGHPIQLMNCSGFVRHARA
jgi:putative NIF3 family GTP cyclohydrolase 1 type 2